MKMTTEEAFVKVLQMHGIEHAFGIYHPIGGLSRISDTMADTARKSGAEIHLASYRNQTQAERGWLILGSRFANELGGLDHEIRKVSVPGKGTFYRLLADGMDPARATKVCADLKRRGQYCDVK